MTGKTKPNACIYLNSSIISELRWLALYIKSAPPVRIFSAISWDPADAKSAGILQLEVFTDASSVALAYYFPSLKLAYHAPLPTNPPSNTIFWFEALAVCCAIHHTADVWACNFSPKLHRLLVHTDNMNSVNMFNTLHAKPTYNNILISSINTRTRSALDVRTVHVFGQVNIIADAVSQDNFELACHLTPGLTILPFTLPRDALGAALQ
jgi:hypothetical protein